MNRLLDFAKCTICAKRSLQQSPNTTTTAGATVIQCTATVQELEATLRCRCRSYSFLAIKFGANFMKFFLSAIKKEPLGALAIVAALLPFIFDVAKEYVFNSVSIAIECGTPNSTDYRHVDGFLYYETRCLINNRSRDPVSVVSLVPVMTHGNYPYPLVGVSDFLPIIEEGSPDRLDRLVKAMDSAVPVNMGGGSLLHLERFSLHMLASFDDMGQEVDAYMVSSSKGYLRCIAV